MDELKIYCVTNKEVSYLENLNLILAGVGKKKFKKNYIDCFEKINIQSKEKHYSELTFHYWFWKNKLRSLNNDTWIGFCQKRRFWLQSNCEINSLKDLYKNILKYPPKKWKKYQSIICKPISLKNVKTIKFFKRGFKNIIKDPSVLFNKNKRTIKLHFDMHHGYGVIEKSIKYLKKEDRDDFKKFINEETSFNPHIMFIAKKDITNLWFNDLFNWLFKCEKEFGTSKLTGYDQQRLYAYLAERYLSFWFKKNTKYLEWYWTFFEDKNDL